MRATIFVIVCVAVAVTLTFSANVPDVELGRNKSPGQQCREHVEEYSGVCKTDDPATRCYELVCADTRSFDVPAPRPTGKPALDGTWCGDKKICLKGSCVDDTQPSENPLTMNDFQYSCEDSWRDGQKCCTTSKSVSIDTEIS